MATPSKDKEGGLMSLFGKKSTGPARQAESGCPLHAAIYAHDKSALKKLIEKENPEKTDSDGRNALHAAVSERDADLVAVVLKKKMNYDAVDKHKLTPLLLAAELGDVKCFEALMKVCSLESKDAKGNNILHLLCANGKHLKNSMQLIKSFLSKGAFQGINGKNDLGETPLFLLCKIPEKDGFSVVDVALLLLRSKADPNVANNNAENCLFPAIEAGSTVLVRTLLEFNCEIQTKNTKGASPVDAARDNAELYEAIRTHMKKVPGGERKLRSTGEEHVIYATKVDDVPEDIRRLVPDVTNELVNANWEVFIHCVHFITKKRIAENEEAAAKARERREAKLKESLTSATPGVISGQKVDQLLTQGQPNQLYKKLTQTGKGGFGMVFSGTGPDKQRVAVKRMPHVSDRDKLLNLREVAFLKTVDHPNIVKMKAAFESTAEHEIWLVMELLEGGTLDEASKDDHTEFTEKHIAFVAREILSALNYLHNTVFIAHRDLKAANVMMSIEGVIKLIDFGLAMELRDGATRTEMVGSPYWMPPEMILSQPHDFKCDIWSMAICVLELANKCPPTVGPAVQTMFYAAVSSAPLPALAHPHNWSAEFKSFLGRALVRDPSQRTPSSELLKDPFLNKAAKQSDMRLLLRQIFMGNQLKENGFF